MGRLNRFSVGQKISPRSGEQRFHVPSYKAFVADHGRWYRHQTNGTSTAAPVFVALHCQGATSL